jgi:thiol-disulfide isomerase/thioredoxin
MRTVLFLMTLAAVTAALAQDPASTTPATLPAAAADQSPEITWKQLQAYLQTPKDEIVVIDFWATWCMPCIEALPDMGKLATAYKGKQVRVVLVSFDDSEDMAAVQEAIKKAGIGFGSYRMKPEDRAMVVKEMHPDWKNIVLPASFVYDKAGKQVYHRLFKTHTLEEWQKVVEALAGK